MSSVPTWKQSYSQLDAEFEANKLAKIVRHNVIRNFGLKQKPYTALIDKKTREDHPELSYIIRKVDIYQADVEKMKLLMEYPDFLIEDYRKKLLKYSDEMLKYIALANAILPQTADEYIDRLKYVDNAIGFLAALNRKINGIEEDFNIDVAKYENYVVQHEKVKKYLYRWKQSYVRDYREFLDPTLKEARLQKEKSRKRIRRGRKN